MAFNITYTGCLAVLACGACSGFMLEALSASAIRMAASITLGIIGAAIAITLYSLSGIDFSGIVDEVVVLFAGGFALIMLGRWLFSFTKAGKTAAKTPLIDPDSSNW